LTDAAPDFNTLRDRLSVALGIFAGDDYGVDRAAPPPEGAPVTPLSEQNLGAGNSEELEAAVRRDATLRARGQREQGQELGGDMTYSGSFAHDLLAALNMPVTFENLKAINAWQRAETGGDSKPRFNPLATTQRFGSWTNFNSVGVKNYADYDTGVRATANVMMNGHYGPILMALARGDSAMNVARAISQTPWGTGEGVMRVLGGDN
jgi:hypothetical protein